MPGRSRAARIPGRVETSDLTGVSAGPESSCLTRLSRPNTAHRWPLLIAHLRADLHDDLWKIAASLGVATEHRPRVGIISDFILANVFAAGEALLDGRIPDAALLASQLAMTTQATCTEFILRYGDPAKFG